MKSRSTQRASKRGAQNQEDDTVDCDHVVDGVFAVYLYAVSAGARQQTGYWGDNGVQQCAGRTTGPNVAIISCNDGLHPVIFKVEVES